MFSFVTVPIKFYKFMIALDFLDLSPFRPLIYRDIALLLLLTGNSI